MCTRWGFTRTLHLLGAGVSGKAASGAGSKRVDHSGGDHSGGAWGGAGDGAGFVAGAEKAVGGGGGEKHRQRASSKAGAGSKRRSQQAAITAVAIIAVAITAAARGVAQAMAQALQRGQKTQWGEGVGEKHWQRVSSKAGAGSKRRSQQVAIKAVAITAAARGVTQAMAQAL